MRRVRWGMGDFFWVFFGGFGVAIVVTVVTIGIAGWDADNLTDNQSTLLSGIGGIAQYGAFWGLLVMILHHKGGGLVHDLGVTTDREVGPIIGWFFAGAALQFAIGISLLPITSLRDQDTQAIVEQIDRSSGLALALLVLTAGVLAPVFEELLFRGLFLRALLRRVPAATAIVVSGSVFGAVHLFDPDAFVILPGLVAIGLVSGWLAVASRGIARSVALHMGFNLITVLAQIAS
jgi:membrane protease YdiL (CAAX protease family)